MSANLVSNFDDPALQATKIPTYLRFPTTTLFYLAISMLFPNYSWTLRHTNVDCTSSCSKMCQKLFSDSPKAQTAWCGVVALPYQHHHHHYNDDNGGVDSEVPQLHITQSAPLD